MWGQTRSYFIVLMIETGLREQSFIEVSESHTQKSINIYIYKYVIVISEFSALFLPD